MSKKRLFLVHGKIFHLVDPVQPQDVFSKDLLGKFSVEMYLFFLSAEITDGILKLAPQKGEGIGTCRLRRFLESEKSSFVMHSSNLVIALNRFHEQCLLEDLE